MKTSDLVKKEKMVALCVNVSEGWIKKVSVTNASYSKKTRVRLSTLSGIRPSLFW